MLLDRSPRERALWGPVSAMRVVRIGPRDVDAWCRRWHYTRHKGTALWCYGLRSGLSLAGVISYNLPARSVQSCVFGPDHWSEVVHMGRLVCADSAPRNSESRLIGLSLKMLGRDRPGTRAVVTYAAEAEGHVGTVYQATNAIYTGVGRVNASYVDLAGRRRAPMQNAGWVSRAEAVAAGWSVHEGGTKHRYVYLLGDRAERRESARMMLLPSLPYPKGI